MAKTTPSDPKAGAKRASAKSKQSDLDPTEVATATETDATEADVAATEPSVGTDEPAETIAPGPDTDKMSDALAKVVEGTETNSEETDDKVEPAADEDAPIDMSPAEEDISEPEAEPQAIPEPVVAAEPRKGGVFPLMLGGLIAGGIGFGASTYMNINGSETDAFKTEIAQTVGGQAETLDTLATRIDAVEAAQNSVDLAAIQGGIDGNATVLQDMLGEIGTLSDAVAAFDSRLSAIEKQPLAEAVSPEAIAAYERELEELRTVLDERKTEIEDLVASERAAMEASVAEQRATIEALASAADQAEASAEEKAALAAARSAMINVTSAVQSGVPYGDALAALMDTAMIDVPEVLTTAAADGAPSQDSLTEAFPNLAFAALAQARKEKTAEEGHTLGNFLQTQLGGRSVVPREGDDPDAVLSRAEAAVKSGDLETALSELTALPDTVQPIFADWVASATTRKDVLGAAAQLAQELNQK